MKQSEEDEIFKSQEFEGRTNKKKAILDGQSAQLMKKATAHCGVYIRN